MRHVREPVCLILAWVCVIFVANSILCLTHMSSVPHPMLPPFVRSWSRERLIQSPCSSRLFFMVSIICSMLMYFSSNLIWLS
ncbi:hypothetical protein EDB80DRAFT_312352 [Ilyonectria destructans]|nr:hypothetical protein EDB80DRAFT_312352 [Ilyonectria destructans]